MSTTTLHDAHYDAFMEEMYEQSQDRMCGSYDEPEGRAVFNEHQRLLKLTGRTPLSYEYVHPNPYWNW